MNEDGDPLLEAKAYNQSVMFMVGVPYLVLMGLIGLIYRACRAADRRCIADAALAAPAQSEAPIGVA